MAQVLGRQVKAAYAFRGLKAAMDRTFPLRADESVTDEGIVRSGTGASPGRQTFVRLTALRLCVLQHFAFRSDLGIEIPRRALITSQREASALVVIWRSDTGNRSLQISPFTSSTAATNTVARRYSIVDLEALAAHLAAWTR